MVKFHNSTFSLANMAYILWLSACVVSITILWYIFEYGSAKRRRMRELAACMPGPPGWPILGNALIFMAKPDDFLKIVMEELMVKYGEYFRLWLGSELLVCVKNPSDIRLLLTSNKINLKGPMYEHMKVFVGPGVLSEGGPIWRSHRKIAAPSFNRRAIQKHSKVFNESAKEFAEVLTKKRPEETFNVYHDAVKSTTMSVCQAIIGLSKEESKNIKSMDKIVGHTQEMYDFLFTNMTHWWYHIPFVYWLFRKTRERYFVKIIDEMTSDMMAKRIAALKKGVPEEPSVLDMLILSGELSEQDIKYETMTFFTASQEASAKILSTVLLILAYRPEWQDKVYQEIIDVLGQEYSPVTDEQLKQLKYLDMVYKEAIRIMPIGAFIQRTVEDEVAIDNGNVILPKGATVVIPIYAVHHDAKYWKDPYTVDPGKFLPENAKGRDPNAFVPYSLGAMDCIGRVLADSMVKTNVVHVLRKVQLEADGRIEDLELSVAISVRVTKGYNVRVKPRVINVNSV
ncbi:cytochrome p450 domain-containing protein [Phthorimaea operculella]|nr:cytochrome p450 domain-containing protein [Phthorimaea operculella]